MRWRKLSIMSVVLLATLSACGFPRLPVDSGEKPYVLRSMPGDGEAVTAWPVIEVEFSAPVLKESVTQYSLFVLNRPDYDAYDEADWVALHKDVKTGEVGIITSSVSVSDDGKSAFLIPEAMPELDGEYVVVALPTIMTPDHEPIDQTAAGADVRQFRAAFYLTTMASDALPAVDGDDAITPSENGSASTEDEIVTEETGSVPAQDGLNDSESSELGSTGTEEADDASAEEDLETDDDQVVITELFDFNRLLITEIVTDPQQDHGESVPGNGIKFDGIPGEGGIGSTDEYVELYNGTGESLDVSDWKLILSDGTDVEESLSDPGWTKLFSAGGSLENFLSGEVLVLGNPNGDMKNAIVLDLIDESGGEVQSVVAEDANAEGMEDEAFRLNELGSWEMGPATPGEFEY